MIIVTMATLGITAGLFANGMNGMGMHQGQGMHNGQGMHQGQGMHKRGGMHKNRSFAILKQLDLTSEQQSKLKDLRQIKKAQMQAQRQERRANRAKNGMQIDMSAFMSTDKFDKEAYKKALEQKAQKRQASMQERKKTMFDKKADFMEKVFNILTPEQRTKWIELSKQK